MAPPSDPTPAPSPPPASPAVAVRRHPERGAYDAAAVHAVLDAGTVAHVGIVAADGRPVVIPTLYGRIDDRLYLHGSVASRLVRSLDDGVDCCLTVTVVDALVLARSAFHHSMDYRSVVVLGRAERVRGDEAVAGLRAISELLLPGRWDEVREPSAVELRQTAVLRLPLAEASAKVRSGPPVDEPEDLDLDVWAGRLPVVQQWGEPVPAPDLRPGLEPSPSVRVARP